MPIKLKMEKNNFLAALGTLQNITAKKGTMAVLANILFTAEDDTIELIGTDLEVGIKSTPTQVYTTWPASPAMNIHSFPNTMKRNWWRWIVK
jgi:DNA polymerase III sliding clamp (beta) subunit (PCNA family)